MKPGSYETMTSFECLPGEDLLFAFISLKKALHKIGSSMSGGDWLVASFDEANSEACQDAHPIFSTYLCLSFSLLYTWSTHPSFLLIFLAG